ncbi:MAG: LytTR family transcriptional regulator [Bacteroidales bacterium]|nr:LytTR family transcriptional regulator [Bacteroidales bacterium]
MNNDSNTIVLKLGNAFKRIAHEDFSHICCEDYVCHIHLIDGTKHSCTKPLSYFEERLPAQDFHRINHNVIVAIRHTEKVLVLGNRLRSAVMKCGTTFPISVRRWKGFKEHFHGT